MRVSREKALENREQIIETAARLLREHLGWELPGAASSRIRRRPSSPKREVKRAL